MADFSVRFKDFSGGDWGETDPAKAKDGQFSGKNVAVYSDGLLGVRAGLKRMDLTGKVYPSVPTLNGNIRGFDVMGNKLIVAGPANTYDVWWDLTLAPGGTLPANNPIPLPAGIGVNDNAQFLRGADTSMKEFLLIGGKLCYRTGDPSGAWTQTGPAGKPLSMVTRWNLYLVGVDQAQPWIIWFSLVDPSGPNFLSWPAANFLYVGTTETITTLLSIFNLLYAGRASGWWGISGVLGVQASVRELAIGNGPIDQRMASVTTDNRIVYWPYQKVPAFWNGERVQLVTGQRMDPRSTFLDQTPTLARTSPNVLYSPPAQRIGLGNSVANRAFATVGLPTVLRDLGTPVWTASPARAADTGTGFFTVTHNLADGTPMPMAPGWAPFSFASITNTAPQNWVATDGTNTAWKSTVATGPVVPLGYVAGTVTFPIGTLLSLFKNGAEIARTTVTTPTTHVSVRTETSFAINDTLALMLYNPGSAPINITASVQTSPNIRRPYLSVAPRNVDDAGDHWVCPATGNYDIHLESCGGRDAVAYQLLVNRVPIASMTPRYQNAFGGDDFTVSSLDANNIALTTGDLVGFGVLSGDYNNGYINRLDGGEGTAQPYLRITNRAKQQQIGVLGVAGDSVAVTPTERRLILLGDDGGQSKLWTYGSGVWTHHYVPMLLAGLAPSDVRGSYSLPEHVVFATKRSFNSEPLQVWSLHHDLDRPGFVSDQWASPYDQATAAGDVLVKGEVSLPQWFDGQGRQSRVRSVIVNFRKWNQGIAAGNNQISARVDACGPYERGVQPGTETTWTEPMSGASTDGTDDSWRFNVGEQGFANGFQVVFTALYGVAIREVIALVDVRTERV